MPTLIDASIVNVVDTSKPTTRTNRMEDPAARTERWQSVRWFGSGGAGTYSFVTGALDGPAGTTSYRRKTWTAAGSIGDTGFQIRRTLDLSAAGNFMVSDYPPGTPVSGYMRHNSATSKRFRIRVQCYNDAGGNLGAVDVPGSALTTDAPVNAWVRLAGVLPAFPEGTTRFLVMFDTNGGGSWAAGESLDAGAMMLGAAGAYFDGSTPSPGYTVAWSGAAHNSESVATRVPQTVQAAYMGESRVARMRRNVFTVPRGTDHNAEPWSYRIRFSWTLSQIADVTNHPLGITTAVRATAPATPSSGSSRGIDHGGNFDAQTVSPGYPVTPGKPLRVSSWVRTSQANRRATMQVRFQSSPMAWVSARLDGPMVGPLPVGEWVEVSWEGVVPASASSVVFRSALHSADTGETYVAGETFDVTGVYVGEPGSYFDGFTQPRIRTNVAVNPRVDVNTNGFGANSSQFWIGSTDTTNPIRGVASFMTSRTDVKTTNANVVSSVYASGRNGTTHMPVVPGEPLAISCAVRVEQPNRQVESYVGFQAHNGTAWSAVGTTERLPSVPIAPGAVMRVGGAGVAPAGAQRAMLTVIVRTPGGEALTGERVWYDDVLVEYSTTIRPYFDGDLSPDPRLRAEWLGAVDGSWSYLTSSETPRWEGTPNASASALWVAG